MTQEPLLRELPYNPSEVQRGLVSCTGTDFCNLALIDTKTRAMALARDFERTIGATRPITIRWSGCPAACGNHHTADIGIQGCKVKVNGKIVDGVHVLVGGRGGTEPTSGGEDHRGPAVRRAAPGARSARPLFPAAGAPRGERCVSAATRPDRAGRVVLVGAGPGDPELITVRGLGWLRRAEVLVHDQLVSPALVDEAPPTALRIFAGKSGGRHCVAQSAINALLIHHAEAGRLVVRLKGGDPFVFGRGGEEALACLRAGIRVEVVPGVSSAVAVPAAAGIPVSHRGLGSSFAVVTGHEDPAKPEPTVDWARLATAVDTLVILMGMSTLPTIAARLIAAGRDAETPAAVIEQGTTASNER